MSLLKVAANPGQEHGFLNLTATVLIPLLPLFTWVTLDKLLNLLMVTVFICKTGIIVLTFHMVVVRIK